MKALKKITAIALAAATAATMTVTASAANFIRYIDSSTYGNRKTSTVIHYTDLTYLGTNTVKYNSIPSGMKEGNSIITIDFTKDSTAKKKIIDPAVRPKVNDYMETLKFVDAKGNWIFKGSYPLGVVTSTPSSMRNVMLMSSRIFMDNFDMTKSTYKNIGGINGVNHDMITIYYNINDLYILPNFDIKLSANGKTWTGAAFNHNFTESSDTTGQTSIAIPTTLRGTTFDVTVNGVSVGKVTLPKTSSGSATINNR